MSTYFGQKWTENADLVFGAHIAIKSVFDFIHKILFKWQVDIGDNFWVLVPDAYLKRSRMLVTKTAKTVTKISKLSPTHLVSNSRRQHRCSQILKTSLSKNSSFEYFLHLNLVRAGTYIKILPRPYHHNLFNDANRLLEQAFSSR